MMKTILFVCHGNTCRSPMAEGLARKRLGARAHVESAGIRPHSQHATPAAVEIMKNDYGVDLSAHRPRSVYDLALDAYDIIIALDVEIYQVLSAAFPRQRDHLVHWQVEDPYQWGEEVYRQTAATIEHEVRKLVDQLETEA